MSGRVVLFEDTVESLTVDIETSADPTGAVPQFSLSADPTQAGAFVNGAWSGGWDAASQKTTAITPTLGGVAAALTIESGHVYTLFARVVVGSETAVWPVGTVVCP